ncbi:MAG: glycosyltransferase [Planctomycetota bacterium]
METANRKLRILFVAHGYPPEIAAGTERVVERLARDYVHLGHTAAVIAGTFEPRPTIQIEKRLQGGVVVYQIHRDDLYFDRWEKTYHPGVSAAISDIINEFKPDVVNVHQFIRLSRDITHLATQARVPVVYTFHDFVTTCLIGFRAPGAGQAYCDLLPAYHDCAPCAGTVSPAIPIVNISEFELLRSDLRNELMLARARCAISYSQREKLAKYHDLPIDMFRVVPLAPIVELPRGSPAPEPPPLRIAVWGMQMERKGAHVLIDAVARCAGFVELDIFGRFDNLDYETRCRTLARGLPIRFHGRFEWDELIHTPLHLAVFPSLTFETFGLTFDEAWALGHPVVATDLGAYRERADDTTILFKPGDSQALADILLNYIKNPGVLAERRLRVSPPARFDVYSGQMMQIYLEAIALGPPPVADDQFQQNAHPDLIEFNRRESEFRRRL